MNNSTYNKIQTVLEKIGSNIYTLNGDTLQYNFSSFLDDSSSMKHLIKVTKLLDEYSIKYLVIGDNSLNIYN